MIGAATQPPCLDVGVGERPHRRQQVAEAVALRQGEEVWHALCNLASAGSKFTVAQALINGATGRTKLEPSAMAACRRPMLAD